MKVRNANLCVVIALAVVQWAAAAAAASVTQMESIAAAQVSIERLRRAATPDWQAIGRAYEQCRPLVAEIDARHGLTYATEIETALRHCAAGEKAKVHQQTLAKGLQHVVVLKIHDLMAQMASQSVSERQNAARQIAALFEGIRPTFVRRDKDFFADRPILEKQADLALADMLRFAEAGGADFYMAANLLKAGIVRTYALSLLFEILEIEKYRNTDIANCDVKLAEAVIFYRIIAPVVARADRTGHRTISACLSGMDYAAFDASLVETILKTSLPGMELR